MYDVALEYSGVCCVCFGGGGTVIIDAKLFLIYHPEDSKQCSRSFPRKKKLLKSLHTVHVHVQTTYTYIHTYRQGAHGYELMN